MTYHVTAHRHNSTTVRVLSCRSSAPNLVWHASRIAQQSICTSTSPPSCSRHPAVFAPIVIRYLQLDPRTLGSGAPEPCPEGTASSSFQLVTAGECPECTPGFYCPDLGTYNATLKCRAGYYCPGGDANSTEYEWSSTRTLTNWFEKDDEGCCRNICSSSLSVNSAGRCQQNALPFR